MENGGNHKAIWYSSGVETFLSLLTSSSTLDLNRYRCQDLTFGGFLDYEKSYEPEGSGRLKKNERYIERNSYDDREMLHKLKGNSKTERYLNYGEVQGKVLHLALSGNVEILMLLDFSEIKRHRFCSQQLCKMLTKKSHPYHGLFFLNGRIF